MAIKFQATTTLVGLLFPWRGYSLSRRVARVRFPDDFYTWFDNSVQCGLGHHRDSNVGSGRLPSFSYALGNQVTLLPLSFHFQDEKTLWSLLSG